MRVFRFVGTVWEEEPFSWVQTLWVLLLQNQNVVVAGPKEHYSVGQEVLQEEEEVVQDVGHLAQRVSLLKRKVRA
jgi:hypothetical protein